ncbi:MAG: hypothetical protein QNJ54_11575 [Prochloraceae cyanobacterium]|nr:hypothetical protein [Prochloraceae cyanobacterium]
MTIATTLLNPRIECDRENIFQCLYASDPNFRYGTQLNYLKLMLIKNCQIGNIKLVGYLN